MSQLSGAINPIQQSALMQSVDVGGLFKGGSYVAVPASQQPGQTIPSQGQSASGSEAQSAGINVSIPGANIAA